MYNLIAILLLAAGVITLGLIVYKFLRGEEKWAARNVLYLIPGAVMLYLVYITAAVYARESFSLAYVINLIHDCVEFLTYQVNVELVAPLTTRYPIYIAAIATSAVLNSLAIILSVIGFFGKNIVNARRAKRVLASGGDIIIGHSDSALEYIAINPNALLWDDKLDGKEVSELIKSGVAVIRTPMNSDKFVSKLVKSEHHMIAFRDCGRSYDDIIKTFKYIKPEGDCLLFLHLEAARDEMGVIKNNITKHSDANTQAFVSCFNLHELLARRFALDYPVSRFIPDEFFNDNHTLKPDKQINVVFIGFGRVNYELFKITSVQFQFAATASDGRLTGAPVNYYIYDTVEDVLHNECFSKLMYEFDVNFASGKRSYEKPQPVCNVYPMKEDVNSIAARKKIRSLVHENSYTVFVISLSDDFSDASQASSIKRLFGHGDNYKIFVRAKQNDVADLAEETDGDIIYFGGKNAILTHACIVNDDLMTFSQNVNAFYNNTPTDKLTLNTLWAQLPLIEQYSNMYNALNLRFKLNVLNFDMVKSLSDGDEEVSRDEFMRVYDNVHAGEAATDLSQYFGTRTSNVLAFMEHLRWNAFYIMNDYRPMKKEEFYFTGEGETRKLQHKDANARKHACLTTYYDLETLMEDKYKIFYATDEVDKTSREFMAFDLFGYDYMVLDRAYDALVSMGYKVIRKRI